MTMNPLQLIERLPYDITERIFACLNQTDCLECMAVSRTWFKLVPLYATFVWRQVDISGDQQDERFKECLGPHVQHCRISWANESQTCAILDMLVQQGCKNLQTLGKLVALVRSCMILSSLSLGFNHCRLPDQRHFMQILAPLTSCLHKLTFTEHSDNMAIIHILALCPNLTHFTLSSVEANAEIYNNEPLRHQPLPDNLLFDRLVYLRLDVVMDKHKRLTPILKRCPHLKYLAVGNIAPDTDVYQLPSSATIDLDLFSQCCPELTFLECNSWEQQAHGVIEDGFDKNGSTGLQQLITREATDYTAPDILPTVMKHQNTLLLLCLGGALGAGNMSRSDWSNIAWIHAPKLRTLSLKYITIPSTVLETIIHQCPALEDVTLWTTEPMQSPPESALRELSNLKRLDLGRFSNSMNRSSFLQSLRSIESLVLRYWGRDMTDDELDALATMEGLRELLLVQSGSKVTQQGLCRFAKNAISLRKLELHNMSCMLSESVLAAWGDMQCLNTLKLVCCKGLTCQGIRDMVDRSKSLRQFNIAYCDLIDTCGVMDYVNNKLAIN